MKKKRPAPSVAAEPLRAPAPSRAAWGLAAAAACALALLGRGFIRSASPTYDEPLHLASGWSYLATGRYRLNITDHPPLAEMWSAFPLLVLKPSLMSGHPDFQNLRRYPYADRFLYGNRVDARLLLDSARVFSLSTLAVLLVAALAVWGFALGGAPAAAGAAWAAAFTPVLVSNLSLVTTDGLSSVLFFSVFCLLSVPRRSGWVWAAAGACAGLALASKFNMVLLAGLVPGLLLLETGIDRAGPGGMSRRRGGAVFALAALFALAACYRFGQAGLWWEGLRATVSRLDQGRASYLLGRHSVEGSLLYFPAALFAKSPLGLLLLSFWGVVVLARRPGTSRLWALAPAAAYFAASLTAKVQIGVRHLLPVMPFLALWAGQGAADLWGRGRAARGLLAVLSLWTVASVMRVQPFSLAYFNEAAGGPAGGWRWLADSNLDWGQDLPALADELEARGNPPVYLAYFGVGDPSYYGIRYAQVLPNWNVPRAGDSIDPAAQSGRVLLAVSATNRVGVYLADHAFFSWLDGRAPAAQPGHSIFLYDLTADAEGRARLAEVLERARHPQAAGLGRTLRLQ